MRAHAELQEMKPEESSHLHRVPLLDPSETRQGRNQLVFPSQVGESLPFPSQQNNNRLQLNVAFSSYVGKYKYNFVVLKLVALKIQ